jgi:tetratricopeptide (TPR) repeat protein
MQLKKYDEAMEFLNKAIEIEPERGRSYTIRARLNLQQEKLDDAIASVSEAIKIDGGDVEARLLRASILLEKEQFDEALDDVNRVLQIEPRLVNAVFLRGMILASKREFPEAIKEIEKLVESEPSDSRYVLQLALLYNADDEPRKAIEIYDEWLEEHLPEDWEGLEGEDEQTQAIKEGMKARRASALRGRGDAGLSLGQHRQAIEDYNDALELQPDDDGVLNNLAWVLATSPEDELRDGKRAIELALKACELTEYKQAHILSTLASGYAEIADFETAKKWAAKAIETSDEAEQTENLKKELASYEAGKPWREKQNVEEEKKKSAENKSDQPPGADSSTSDNDDSAQADANEKDLTGDGTGEESFDDHIEETDGESEKDKSKDDGSGDGNGVNPPFFRQ